MMQKLKMKFDEVGVHENNEENKFYKLHFTVNS